MEDRKCRQKTSLKSLKTEIDFHANPGSVSSCFEQLGLCPCQRLNLLNIVLVTTINSRLADTPLLWSLAITDKIQIPGEGYRGLTGYYGITETIVVPIEQFYGFDSR